MLKVIAEDFIKHEHLNTVLPWYTELVEKPARNHCASPTTCSLIKKTQATSFLSNNGPIRRRWMRTARPSTSLGWYHKLMHIRPNHAGYC